MALSWGRRVTARATREAKAFAGSSPVLVAKRRWSRGCVEEEDAGGALRICEGGEDKGSGR